MKKALITGVSGQDGFFLSEILTSMGYEVYGIVRNSTSLEKISRLKNINIKKSNILRYQDIEKIIREVNPDEIYNLAAETSVVESFKNPIYTHCINSTTVSYFLSIIKNFYPNIKFFQASSGAMFQPSKQKLDEDSKIFPKSPYSISKSNAYFSIINYRESFKIFSCQAILFAHESSYRESSFVTEKIAMEVVKYFLKKQNKIILGNIDIKKDFGYAKDFCEAMPLIMNCDVAGDFIISTGNAHSIREFLIECFNKFSIKIESNGESSHKEKLINSNNGEVVVEIDKNLYRPNDPYYLIGDYSKANKILNWKPSTSFEKLIDILIENYYNIEIKKS